MHRTAALTALYGEDKSINQTQQYISSKDIESTANGNETKRSLSPTYALTTDRPPYANYPILVESHLKPKEPFQNVAGFYPGYYLRLQKKCYYGNELSVMPWAKTAIDLSFPEIKTVQMEAPYQKP